jgi:hypothetical protein
MGAWCALAAPTPLNLQRSLFCLLSELSGTQNHRSMTSSRVRARHRTMAGGDA